MTRRGSPGPRCDSGPNRHTFDKSTQSLAETLVEENLHLELVGHGIDDLRTQEFPEAPVDSRRVDIDILEICHER